LTASAGVKSLTYAYIPEIKMLTIHVTTTSKLDKVIYSNDTTKNNQYLHPIASFSPCAGYRPFLA
jgi:hypothetical protein